MSNERIVGMDAAGVRLSVPANHKGGKAGKRVITIDGPEFRGRLLQHVLPSPVGWSGNSNSCVQWPDHAKRAPECSHSQRSERPNSVE